MPFNPNRINIHELTIEEPEKPSELPFDPERDITEEDWSKMTKELEVCRKGTGMGADFSFLAMNMKILKPEFELSMDTARWQDISYYLEGYRKGNHWESFCLQAVPMKFINPNRELNINQKTWKKIIAELENDRKKDYWGKFIILASAIKILDCHQNLKLDEKTWCEMNHEFKECRGINGWWTFSWYAASIKILDPTQDLNLDQDAWKGMKEELDKRRKGFNVRDFSNQAMRMAILAAEEVKVTDKGLEITMPKKKMSLKSNMPPLPETKKF